MALEGLSGAMYHDTVNRVQKPMVEVRSQGSSTMNINVTEVPVTTKVSSNNQLANGHEKGQNPNTASEQQIREAISKANNRFKGQRTRCEFSYHEETKRVSIKVLDKETQEIIREIPPEETLDMIERMWELAGILVDEKR